MRTVVAVALLLSTGPAFSQALSAGDLQKICVASAPGQAMACSSYIQGYVNGRNQSPPRPTICVPQGVSIRDAVAGYVSYLAKNRLESNIEAGLVLGNYLLSAYPCR